MPTMAEVRQQFPQYDDMPDDQLADALHRKFYSDMPREEFNAKIGIEKQESTLGDRFWNDTTVGSILRAAISGATLPGDVYQGKVDPGSDEAIGRSAELASFGAPLSAARGTGKAIAGAVAHRQGRPLVPPPSAKELKDTATKGFEKVREMGVDYKPEAVQQMAGGAKAMLEKDGLTPRTAKATHEILDQLASPPDGAIASLQGLTAARQELRAIAQAETKLEGITPAGLAANRVIAELDSFIAAADPKSVVAGPAAAAGKLQSDSIANYAAGKSSERLSTLEGKAGLRAAAANSGQNLDNAIRSRVASVLESPKKRAGFNKEELAFLEEVVRGTLPRNALRGAGNMLGGGGGLGAAVSGGIAGTVGFAAGGPVGAAIGAAAPIAGYAAKKGANALTTKALGKADAARRSRSPLYDDLQRAAKIEGIEPQQQSVLMRALLLSAHDTPSVSEMVAP